MARSGFRLGIVLPAADLVERACSQLTWPEQAWQLCVIGMHDGYSPHPVGRWLVGRVRQNGVHLEKQQVTGAIGGCIFHADWPPEELLHFVSGHSGWRFGGVLSRCAVGGESDLLLWRLTLSCALTRCAGSNLLTDCRGPSSRRGRPYAYE
jgi:hypothetical protein